LEKIKIVVDGFGGDNAPEEIVKGAKKALDNIENLEIVMTGKQEKLLALASENKIDMNRFFIVDAQDVITNNESPTVAIKTKTESSLVKAFDLLKNDGSVSAIVSAGSTGAVLTGGFIKAGRIKGISRPALAPTLPTLKGTPVLLIDCGANMDSKPINLVHFALMGNKYMQTMFGIENPRIALLNVGTEDHKGNELIKKVFPVLKELPINFVGNMEARELLSGDYDVVVADGFAGNVLLKSTEGAVATIMKCLKRDIMSHTSSKIGALFMKGTFKRLKQTFDYSVYGGSPFLGVNKIVIKSHGDSKEESIYQAIKQAYVLSQSNMIESISDCVKNLDIKIEE
jgi:glycerol-3-phosphate acyltransferase PlsX